MYSPTRSPSCFCLFKHRHYRSAVELIERLLPTPEICGLSPVIDNFIYWIEKMKTKKKRQGMALLKQLRQSLLHLMWKLYNWHLPTEFEHATSLISPSLATAAHFERSYHYTLKWSKSFGCRKSPDSYCPIICIRQFWKIFNCLRHNGYLILIVFCFRKDMLLFFRDYL